MEKPWLLMNQREREERARFYNALISGPIVDADYALMFEPPRTKTSALLELYMWQVRNKVRKERVQPYVPEIKAAADDKGVTE